MVDHMLESKRILYVEDDALTRDELAFFLGRICGTLYTAENGLKGLETFRQHRPDIVITDVQMPVMSGLEMLEAIRVIDRDVPVVVTTAFNETGHLLSAINKGASRYLLKPLSLKELHEVLKELIAQHKQPLPYQSLDENGRVLDVNQSWLDFLGYKQDEVIGHYIGDFVADDYQELLKTSFPILKSQGFLNNVRFQMKAKGGALIEVVLNATVLSHLDGSFDRTHCELRNIDFFMQSEARTSGMLEQERYLKGLISTHATIGQAVSRAQTVNAFLDDVCNAFVDIAAFELAVIALTEGNKHLKIVKQSRHEVIDIAELVGSVIELSDESQCIACQAMLSRSLIIIDDLSKIEQFDHQRVLESQGINAIVAFPIGIASSNADIGVLTLMLRKNQLFGKEELELFKSISETVAFGMQAISDRLEKERLMKKLHLYATTDLMTGCINRRRGVEILAGETERFGRYGHPLSVMFFDVDRFKAVNDTHGHEEGDRVLRSIAECVRTSIRSTDTTVRWGGEEFVVILPETRLEQAVLLAEKLRSEIGAIVFGKGFRTSASFGVAELRQGEGWEELISRADTLMYRAKDKGRNRVEHD